MEGLQNRFIDAIFISAKEQIGVSSLFSRINDMIRSDFTKDVFNLSYNQISLLDTIYALTHVLKKKEGFNGIELEVEGRPESLNKIRQIIEK